MKPIIAICLVVIAALAIVEYADSAAYGARKNATTTNILIYRENVIRAPLKNNYQTADVIFPRSGQYNNRTITGVYIYDRLPYNSGAHSTLKSGGVGLRFVSIHFQSQYNKGINSTVEIYGKK